LKEMERVKGIEPSS